MTAWLIFTLVLSVILGWVMTQIHLWLPDIFTLPASFPYLDGLTTVMSFVAMWLMARRHMESWIYWIIVDVIGIGLYFSKGIMFVALLYVVLLVMASFGAYSWYRILQQPDKAEKSVSPALSN